MRSKGIYGNILRLARLVYRGAQGSKQDDHSAVDSAVQEAAGETGRLSLDDSPETIEEARRRKILKEIMDAQDRRISWG